MVPLQVVFAYGIALLLARARKSVSGCYGTLFYLLRSAPPVAADARIRLQSSTGDRGR